MPTQRKYPISIGMTYELLQMLDEKVAEGGFRSRSQLVEKILRENMDEGCVHCSKIEKLTSNHLLSLPYEIEGTMEDLDNYISEKLEFRRKRSLLIDTIREESNLENIVSKLNQHDFDREQVLLWIDRLCMQGFAYQHPKGQFHVV